MFLNISTLSWFYISILCALVHHIYTLWSWRAELNHKFWTKRFGVKKGLQYHANIFFILILLRPLSIIALSIADRDSFYVNDITYWIVLTLISVPAIYTMYCVVKYFGLIRATGADHFDSKYRKMGLVKKGIFKYVPNSMYTLAALGFWIPGWALRSKTGLLIALFTHIGVWLHYFYLEKPDMRKIYGSKKGVN